MISSPLARASVVASADAPNDQNTLFSRLRTYKAAWQRIESDPFIGRGLDRASEQVGDPVAGGVIQVHNLFLGRWYDSGILGLIGVTLIVIGIGRLGWRLVLTSPDRLFALSVFAGYIAFVVNDMSEPGLYERYSLVPALLIVVGAAIQRRRARGIASTLEGPVHAVAQYQASY